jgi:hypothetical protein
MVAVTVVAVIFALLAIAGEAFLTAPLAIFLRGVLPTIFVVCAIYGRSDLQTFAIGAVVPCVPLLTTDMGPISGSSLLAASIGQLFVSAICGVVAVAVRRWIVSLG